MSNEHTVKSYEEELRYLIDSVIKMGSLTETQLVDSMDAVIKVDKDSIDKIIKSDDEINKGMNVYVDKVYGKPFNKKKNSECNKSTYDLIPGSKEEIEKLSRTIYQG